MRNILAGLLLLGALPLIGQNSCQPSDVTDSDGDGWDDCATAPAGELCDCDDSAIGTNPAAMDICEDGIDQNCDGEDATCGETPTPDPTPTVPADIGCVEGDLGDALGSPVWTGYVPYSPGVDGGSCGGESANEEVFLWRAPVSGTYKIDAGGTELDTVMYVRDGGCNAVELACNDDDPSLLYGASGMTLDLEQDQYLVIYLDFYDIFYYGDAVLNISLM